MEDNEPRFGVTGNNIICGGKSTPQSILEDFKSHLEKIGDPAKEVADRLVRNFLESMEKRGKDNL